MKTMLFAVTLSLWLPGFSGAETPFNSEPLKKALANLNERLRAEPNLADAYQARGSVYFKLGNFKEAIRDFDRYIELRPERKAGHWERGIAYYYDGQYDAGRRQFEGYQQVDSNDVENAVWRFMCMAKTAGIARARKDMLKVGVDRRVPMREVYEMFSGKLKPADVLVAAEAGEPSDEALRLRLFYADLYLGIYYDLEGDRTTALRHLNLATDKNLADHYMWHVARVHRDVLAAKMVGGTKQKGAPK
jgi:lipoprotein NlpI